MATGDDLHDLGAIDQATLTAARDELLNRLKGRLRNISKLMDGTGYVPGEIEKRIRDIEILIKLSTLT